MFKKLYDWFCNCKNRPPRAAIATTDRCNREAGGFGENPLQGVGCTEPPIGPDGDLPVIDPPRCYGGVGPCDPMPSIFRVAFPCNVPGSTCQPQAYAVNCCFGLTHFDFAGASSESCGFTAEETATEITLVPKRNCTASASVTVGGKTIDVSLVQPSGGSTATITITIGDCSKTYICAVFANCGGEFTAVDDDSGDTWPSSFTLVSGAGESYTGPPVDVTPCPTNAEMDQYVIPDGPAPLFPPFQDCPTCWTINPSGIATGFGGVSDSCCSSLNGSHTLCYSPKESQGDNLIFGTPCLSSGGDCGPGKYDTQRRLWQLSYNKTAMKWRLESLASIKSPAYELDDETPCTGDTKTLTKVTGDTDSGCSTAPDTITLTRGTDEQCADCSSYGEPGCQVQLVRQCGSDNYALRHTSVVSADPKLSHICNQSRGNRIKQCCDVGCNYTPAIDGECPCSIQKVMYSANNDPWFDPGGSHEIWSLDLDADPVTLTGNFFEGNIVYEVDSNGVQCGKTPTQLYLASSTLPDNLKQLYPNNVCMVGDILKTCNVRYMTAEEEGVDQNFLGGPCNSAGYSNADEDTAHADFCDCNDSCAPVIAGTISVGGCITNVCAARVNITQKGAVDARSRYSYIACAKIWNEGNERYDVITQVMYCVGPGNRWASDWYCTIGQPEDIGALTPRLCTACSVYLGDYLGTTFADRNECDTLPFFAQPGPDDFPYGGSPPEGYSGCVCSPCKCFEAIGSPAVLHYHLETAFPGSPCNDTGNPTTGDYTLNYKNDGLGPAGGGEYWINEGPNGSANVAIQCFHGQWNIYCSQLNTGDIDHVIAPNQAGCPGLLLEADLIFASCPFHVTITL